MKKATILRDLSHVELEPTSPEAEKFLSYVEKQMVRVGYDMKAIYQKVNMFEHTARGLTTYPGFYASLCAHLRGQGWDVETVDCRETGGWKMPVPNLQMIRQAGLRYSQASLLVTALAKRESGLIGAPTRYGKTYLMLATAAAFSKYRVVVLAPGIDLLKQLANDFRERFSDREVVQLGGGSGKRKMSKDGITVCSADSIKLLDVDSVDVLLIDEPHAFVTDTRAAALSQFPRALRIGFGATLQGRFDNRDQLIVGLIGPVLAQVDYRQAVAEGAIAECQAVFVRHKFRYRDFPQLSRNGARNAMLMGNRKLGEFVKEMDRRIPADWQTLHFIENEKQGKFFSGYLPDENVIMMAKRLGNKERAEKTQRIKDGEVTRVLCSKIYIQGVTFPHVRILNNLAGGGANTGAIQKPGRLLQQEPWKNYGLLIEHLFECEDHSNNKDGSEAGYQTVIGEAWSRLKLYKKLGYTVRIVDTIDELEEIIKASGGPIPNE